MTRGGRRSLSTIRLDNDDLLLGPVHGVRLGEHLLDRLKSPLLRIELQQCAVDDCPELAVSVELAARAQEGFGARMAAGYCWPWSDPRPDGSLVPDVQIAGWARPWNLKGDRSTGGAPPAALGATATAGFGQVGCVYSAQGFEYDYAGVIIGPDLVWRTDRWVSVRDRNRDPDFRNRSRVEDAFFDRSVRNVYKVLLTRGLLGVVIYSTDAETRYMLRGWAG